ncbi:MAG: hypothetical protein JST71_11745 [Bacteroidetes bacterium]|nr:hypothetical protein [Bacteroidota bacterium]MCW5919504.1 hypothetical protein [Bacteroidota bacterium]HCI58077.1 hypothetical protein [Bacteroidota bacterium]HRC91330.1 hypothetical protein [Bacteroidia bacterium]
MNIIEKLFGGRAKTENPVTTITDPQLTVADQPENIPPMDIFIDNEVPQPERQLTEETKSKITLFLERNYHSMGINDGYEYHSHETLEMGKKKIRAEFQLIVDQTIQEKSERRLQLRMLIVNVEKIAEETKRNLELTIEELNSSIALLQKQKELSAENEGWVMNAIHSYHQGFVQGLSDYIAGENLLNSIKNI